MTRRRGPSASERLHALLALPADASSGRALVAAVADPSLDVARVALRRLRTLAGPGETATLRARMLTFDIGLVADVASTLRSLEDPRAAAVAAAALDDGPPPLRHKAALALRELRDPETRAVLVRALADPETPVRRVALEALTRLPADPATVAACRARVGDRDPSVRRAAIDAIARLDGDARATLRPCLHDADPRVRARLGAVGDALDTGTLRALLDDPDATVRASTLQELARRPRCALAPALVAALGDPSWHVRRAACDAIAASRGDGATDALVAALLDPHPSVRGRSLVALERLLGDDLEDALERRLDDPSPRLRRALVEILGRRRRTRRLHRVASDPDAGVRIAVALALGGDGSPAARATLGDLCRDEELAVRHAALTALDERRSEAR